MRALALILVIALAGAGYYLLTPQGRELIDRVTINLTRKDHKARFHAGETLPGTPDLGRIDQRLASHGVAMGAPVFIRIFKLESELELWVEKDGRFEHFATYPICLWSGRLGPKLKEGDRQAPEGFYTVDAEQLNPNSVMHRSFSLGFPNLYDQTYGRTGSFLMVHGGCASVGCYAVTHPVVDEIWRLVTAALEKGQPRFAVQALKWEAFWAELKTGYDLFERSHVPPAVSVCKGHYVFEPGTQATENAPVEERCRPEVAETP
jgi:murein L,D-transpeptidase YafK